MIRRNVNKDIDVTHENICDNNTNNSQLEKELQNFLQGLIDSEGFIEDPDLECDKE